MNDADIRVPANARAVRVGPHRREQDPGKFHHGRQRREDEPDGRQVRVPAEEHALGRLHAGQRVAEDETVAHLQPVTHRRVQHEARGERDLPAAAVGLWHAVAGVGRLLWAVRCFPPQ